MLVGLLALGACWRPASPAPRFQLRENVADAAKAQPLFESRIAWRPEGIKEVHGSSLVALPNDELLMVYYGGSHESALDVRLYLTRFSQGQWQTPTAFLSPQDVGEAAQRYVRRVGNSSMFRDAQGRIHLFFVSVGYFGWSCSSLNQMTSLDDGKTWSNPKRLLTSPFFNVSTLVRSPAVPLQNGGFLLPVYIEFTNKFPEALEFDQNGTFVRKTRLTGEHGYLQACLMPVSETSAHAYLRNRHYEVGKLAYQNTSDGGQTWSEPSVLSIDNNDSPVAVARITPDCMIMVYNPTYEREKIRLAVSKDGTHWRDLMTLDQSKLNNNQTLIEYSYPTIAIHYDLIDLVYTYHRQGFRHYRFNVAWLKEQLRD